MTECCGGEHSLITIQRMRLTYRILFSVGLLSAAAAADVAVPGPLRSERHSMPQEPRSIVILRDDEIIRAEPAATAARRGSAAKEARLPLYATTPGPGCSKAWLQVGPLAWICGDHVRLSHEPPIDPAQASRIFEDGLPYQYHFVGNDGSLGYRVLSSAEEGPPDQEFEPGFALAIQRTAFKPGGDLFGLTAHRLWIPMRDLGPARPILFEGRAFEPGYSALPGWVVSQSAPVYGSVGGKRLAGESKTRFEELDLQESRSVHGKTWWRIGPARWIRGSDVRVRTPAEPPPFVRPDERWIDIDVKNQVLTAYVGARPVFSTLVSTGRGPDPGLQATPKGVFRIWVKLLGSDMDNLESEQAGRYYSIQRVPWVMYFKDGFGLHGTFWHRSFGHVQSHGCVNLTPLDAQRVFAWTRPRLPAGRTAVLPTPYDQGTVISVR